MTAQFASIMQITPRPPLVFARGEGHYLWDSEGNKYLVLSRDGPSTAWATVHRCS
jgi:acetylornithine/succinyldiaminopimelate/putrescine aminotransferase